MTTSPLCEGDEDETSDPGELREDLAQMVTQCPDEGMITALECAGRRVRVMPFFNPPHHPSFDRNGELKAYANCLECEKGDEDFMTTEGGSVRRKGKAKTDLSGYSCEGCGKPATEVKQFNIKWRKCSGCMQKVYDDRNKEKAKAVREALKREKEGGQPDGAPEPPDNFGRHDGDDGPIEYRFCPGCGVDLSKEGSVIRALRGHVDAGNFVTDTEEDTYCCSACARGVR